MQVGRGGEGRGEECVGVREGVCLKVEWMQFNGRGDIGNGGHVVHISRYDVSVEIEEVSNCGQLSYHCMPLVPSSVMG